MTKKTIRHKMTEVFRDIFKKPDLELFDDMNSNDIEGWDSLKHVSLILALEKSFSITFEPREILSIKKHSDMENLIKEKLEIN
jgi:Acyl carrier protein